MKKRFFKTAPILLICAALLCGCAENENVTAPQSDTSQIMQTQPASTAASASKTESDLASVPASVGGSTVPALSTGTAGSQTSPEVSSQEPISSDNSLDSIPSQSVPQSTSSKPASVSTSSKPVSTPASSKPASVSTSSTSTTTSSSGKPTSSSTNTQSSVSGVEITPPPVTSASLLENYTQKWAYNQLDAKQKIIYARLFESASNVTESCDISDLEYTLDDLRYINTAFWAFDYDNPQFLELGSGYEYSYSLNAATNVTRMKALSIVYARTPAQIRGGEFNKTAQSVIEAAKALPGDYEKLKYIHDWIVNNTVYTNTDSDYEREADGPLVYGKAVCEGYSKAFMYLAQSLGFDCVCVSGTANEAHMWNKVKLGGKWYNVDVTWDDPVRSDGVQVLRHSYFLISDKDIGRDHTAVNEFTLPSAAESYAR